MPPISVLIKPASSLCNLQCKYCFYRSIADHRDIRSYGIMQKNVLETVIRKVLSFADGIATFSFQGGEPTLCGLDFFREVVRLQKKYNTKKVHIQNCLQTNGILIDEDWAGFLQEHNFLVGLSLDGPEDIHDKYRVDMSDKGTYARVMETARLFDAHRVEYNILFVVNRANAAQPKRLYEFFRAQGFNFLQFIPCIDPEGYARGSLEHSLTNDAFANFLKEMFDPWYDDLMAGREVSIRYFDNLVRMAMGMRPETCSMQGTCSCQFVFEADGGVYPCDFYVTDEWRMGNILDADLMALYQTEPAQRFIKSSLPVAKACGSCAWYSLCRGGCRRDRQDNLSGEIACNTYCEAYKSFFQYAEPKIRKLAAYISSR